MDRDEALRLLTGGSEGAVEWNRRRQEGEAIPDLGGAHLRGAHLYEADLYEAHLRGVDLVGADLRRADLRRADLGVANLRGANLSEAHLVGADLVGAHLVGADLVVANLVGAHLYGANLEGAKCHRTIFGDVDLSNVKGLNAVIHEGPSTVGTDTLIRSEGKIPEVFLRGCGVPDSFITYLPALISSMSPIQFYSVFISYSTKDEAMVNRLYADLQAKGVRCWYAPDHLKIGDRIRVGIDEAIRVHDKLLLVLSEHSVASDWVEKEVEKAMEQERRQKRTVLFPIQLDTAVTKVEDGWPADIRLTRNIGDFRKWKNHDAYQKAFDRLLRDLQASSKSSP